MRGVDELTPHGPSFQQRKPFLTLLSMCTLADHDFTSQAKLHWTLVRTASPEAKAGFEKRILENFLRGCTSHARERSASQLPSGLRGRRERREPTWDCKRAAQLPSGFEGRPESRELTWDSKTLMTGVTYTENASDHGTTK